MLEKQALLYFIARILPAVVNFGAVAVFTRLLTPAEYGRYALVIAATSLVGAVCFQWLRQVLLRYYARYQSSPAPIMSAIVFLYATLSLIVGIGVVAAYQFFPDAQIRLLLGIGYVLVIVQSIFGLLQELARARLAPKLFGLLALIRSTTSLLFGIVLIWVGLRESAVLIGLALGSIVSLMTFGWSLFRGFSFHLPTIPFTRSLLAYGLPFAATFSLQFVINSSDRFIIGGLLDAAAVGAYAVAYDFANLSLAVLLVTVNLAAYPLALQAFENRGPEAARARMAENGNLLLSIGLPAAIGISLLAGNISYVILGAEFQSAAEALLPWIAFATLIGGIKAYHFDLAFHFGEKTRSQIPVSLAAATVNVVATLLLVPHLGLIGAAIGSIIAMVTGLIYSAQAGKRYFTVPNPFQNAKTYVWPSLGMAALLVPVANGRGIIHLIMQVALGLVSYALLYIGFHPTLRSAILLGVRRRIKRQ